MALTSHSSSLPGDRVLPVRNDGYCLRRWASSLRGLLAAKQRENHEGKREPHVEFLFLVVGNESVRLLNKLIAVPTGVLGDHAFSGGFLSSLDRALSPDEFRVCCEVIETVPSEIFDRIEAMRVTRFVKT